MRLKILSGIIIPILVALITIIATFYHVSYQIRNESRQTSKIEIYTELWRDISTFSNYNEVNWEKYGKEYRPYQCDFPKQFDVLYEKAREEWPEVTFCDFWKQLANAKDDFHNKTFRARLVASGKVIEKMDGIERGFDEVYGKILKDYYSRSFVDKYDDTMSEKFNQLEQALRQEVSTGE